MTVLVSGAAGFLGRTLLERVSGTAEIVAVSRASAPAWAATLKASPGSKRI